MFVQTKSEIAPDITLSTFEEPFQTCICQARNCCPGYTKVSGARQNLIQQVKRIQMELRQWIKPKEAAARKNAQLM